MDTRNSRDTLITPSDMLPFERATRCLKMLRGVPKKIESR